MSGVREWPASLDVPALLATGWRPTPLRQFVIKTHARCDLACDYCYVYRMADQSWRDRPAVMSPATVRQTARRIAEHADTHGLTALRIVLHGGEPLLAGPKRLGAVVDEVRRAVGTGVELTALVQTNGSRLTSAVLAELAESGIRIGVSLDGGRAATDRHRRHRDGRSSFPAVARGLRLLSEGEYRELFDGLLCTIDLASDPVATYEELLDFAPPSVDFLLPHGNWTDRPPGRAADESTPYGDWLIAVFDRWYPVPRRETEVRLFAEILNLVLGGQSRIESVGLSPVGFVVVETDGGIEQVDSLRSAYPGAAETALTVAHDAFDDALRHPAIAARQLGVAALGTECGPCEVRDVCGGGLYAHRYRAGSGFRNPSVYCPDLFALIRHVNARVRADLARHRDGVPG